MHQPFLLSTFWQWLVSHQPYGLRQRYKCMYAMLGPPSGFAAGKQHSTKSPVEKAHPKNRKSTANVSAREHTIVFSPKRAKRKDYKKKRRDEDTIPKNEHSPVKGFTIY